MVLTLFMGWLLVPRLKDLATVTRPVESLIQWKTSSSPYEPKDRKFTKHFNIYCGYTYKKFHNALHLNCFSLKYEWENWNVPFWRHLRNQWPPISVQRPPLYVQWRSRHILVCTPMRRHTGNRFLHNWQSNHECHHNWHPSSGHPPLVAEQYQVKVRVLVFVPGLQLMNEIISL